MQFDPERSMGKFDLNPILGGGWASEAPLEVIGVQLIQYLG